MPWLAVGTCWVCGTIIPIDDTPNDGHNVPRCNVTPFISKQVVKEKFLLLRIKSFLTTIEFWPQVLVLPQLLSDNSVLSTAYDLFFKPVQNDDVQDGLHFIHHFNLYQQRINGRQSIRKVQERSSAQFHFRITLCKYHDTSIRHDI